MKNSCPFLEGFLSSWPIVKEQLEEVLKDDEGLSDRDRNCIALPCKCEDNLQTVMGEGDTRL
jgi:hypothetical protein